MDIKQEMANVEREHRAAMQKANEIQEQVQVLLQIRQETLLEAAKLEGEIRALKRLNGAKPKKEAKPK